MVDIPNVKDAEPIPEKVMSDVLRLMSNGDLFRYNSEGSAAEKLEIDFSIDNEQYLIAYSKETNFSMGGSMIGVLIAHKRLQKTGEPFKFRTVSKEVWWKLHGDLVARGSERMYSPFKVYSDEDLQQARDMQGVSP